MFNQQNRVRATIQGVGSITDSHSMNCMTSHWQPPHRMVFKLRGRRNVLAFLMSCSLTHPQKMVNDLSLGKEQMNWNASSRVPELSRRSRFVTWGKTTCSFSKEVYGCLGSYPRALSFKLNDNLATRLETQGNVSCASSALNWCSDTRTSGNRHLTKSRSNLINKKPRKG